MELFVRYCAETGRFNTLKCIWNLSKNSTAARVFPFGQRCRFCLCFPFPFRLQYFFYSRG